MSTLPDDMITTIHSYLGIPEILSRENIKKCCRENACFYLSFHPLVYPNCTDLFILYGLLNKYSCYQKNYEVWSGNPNRSLGEQARPWGLYHEDSPILLDLLFTGCNLPFANSTFDYFDETLANDLVTILRIVPNTIHSKYGVLRCRTNVSPLDAACVNTNIDFNVIQTLLDNGADINHKLFVNGFPVHITDDLDDDRWKWRKAHITKMFVKKGFITSNNDVKHYP